MDVLLAIGSPSGAGKMADRIAEYFAGTALAHIGASPLERALETAQPIAARHDLEVATDERLIEADNVFQGLTFGVGDGALDASAPLASSSESFHSFVGRAV